MQKKFLADLYRKKLRNITLELPDEEFDPQEVEELIDEIDELDPIPIDEKYFNPTAAFERFIKLHATQKNGDTQK